MAKSETTQKKTPSRSSKSKASLKTYEAKRDFRSTPEPKGSKTKGRGPKAASKGAQNTGLKFTIQKHHASHLHYDLRLELQGVLMSWAVPKGLSTDPDTKRLAMETEPHPMEYLHFEGVIPKGNYGAGNMIVWDTGTYTASDGAKATDPEDALVKMYRKGKMDIEFFGQKVQGKYTLVRTRGRPAKIGDKSNSDDSSKSQWLIFKRSDAHVGDSFDERSVLSHRLVDELDDESPMERAFGMAKKSPFPDFFRPMLAKLTDEPFSDDQWLYEVKFDGYRCLVFKSGDQVTLYSRNGNKLGDKYGELIEAAQAIGHDGVFDGEIIVPGDTGAGDFQGLQQYLKQKKKGDLRLALFDVVWLDGYDLSSLPLVLRKEVLEQVMNGVPKGPLKYSAHIEGDGIGFLKEARKMGLEGVIAKKKESKYSKGRRNANWLKFKNVKDEDLAVIAATPSTDSQRAFGSLLLARPLPNGGLQYAGKVGTGFSQDDTRNILSTLKRKKIASPPLKIKEEVLFWVEPHFLAQVGYAEKTEEGKLRHPRFMALRDDKYYDDEVEKIKFTPGKPGKKTGKAKRQSPSSELSVEDIHEKIDDMTVSRDDSRKKNPSRLSYPGLEFTNTDKIFFPDSAITKGDVIAYYDKVSEAMLSYLKDRPLMLKRNPNGIKDQGFYQKDVEGTVPNFVDTVKIKSKSSEKDSLTYALCNNKKTLLFLANWGTLEFHAMNSRVDHLASPDHIVFDLDPDDNSLDELRLAAFTLKSIFDEWGLEAGLKTSGSRGLHLYVPLQSGYTHEQAKDTAHAIAKLWHRELPDLTSLERSPSKRRKKIYLDYLQNGRGKTMVVPYSLRVRPTAPVSMPLSWDQLKRLNDVRQYHLGNTFRALSQRKADPWKGLYRHRVKLETIVEKLESSRYA